MVIFRGPVMSRIPAAATTTLVGLLPVCAAALGLGEIQSRSYLNEPLAAEIPVLSASAGRTADAQRQSRLGRHLRPNTACTRPAFLGDLNFSGSSRARRRSIRVTSPQPVMEPFVTLLIEVRWPQGRLLREYTVLLDPPSFTRRRRAGARADAAGGPAGRARGRAGAGIRARGRLAPSGPAMRRPAAPAAPTAPAEDGTHLVQRNETLWGIADRYRGALRRGYQPGDARDLSRQSGSLCRQHQPPEPRRGAAHPGSRRLRRHWPRRGRQRSPASV